MCIRCVRVRLRNTNLTYNNEHFRIFIDDECIFIGIIKNSVCVLVAIDTERLIVSRRRYISGTDYYTVEQYNLDSNPVKFGEREDGIEYAVIVNDQHLCFAIMDLGSPSELLRNCCCI